MAMARCREKTRSLSPLAFQADFKIRLVHAPSDRKAKESPTISYYREGNNSDKKSKLNYLLVLNLNIR